MVKKALLRFLLVASVFIGRVATGDTLMIDSKLADSYHFVDTYETLINASPDKVWPHLLDVGSWMYEFSMIHESGPPNAEGAAFRLYEGQDYFMQFAKLIPGKLMIAVNLPSSIGDEQLSGIAMVTLTEIDGKTLVSNFMTRQSVQVQGTGDSLRDRRESAEYRQSTRDRWSRFMVRLRRLAEGTYDDG